MPDAFEHSNDSTASNAGGTPKKGGSVATMATQVGGADEELAVCLLCGMLLRPGKRVFGVSREEAVRELRFRVFCATRLTCSAGNYLRPPICRISARSTYMGLFSEDFAL